jgi:hypothetical protein
MSNIEESFDKGAFVLSRSIFDSEIWFKPPEYFKIWIYLIGRANHKDRRYRGFELKRGQCFCNHAELQEQLKYNVGYRKKTITDSYVKNILKYLRDNQMITTTKKPRGIIVEVLKYNLYQTLSNYEKTNEKSYEKPSSNPGLNQDTPPINKNDKELEKLKKNDNDNDIPENPGCNDDSTSINFNRELSEKETDLIDEIISWAYNPENNFKQEKSIEETREQIENTIRKHGYETIESFFTECSQLRRPWDYGEDNKSAYSEFWVSVQSLRDYTENKKIQEKIPGIVKAVNSILGTNFEEKGSKNLIKIISNNADGNDIVKFLQGFKKNGFKDSMTLEDIFSKKNWEKFLTDYKKWGKNLTENSLQPLSKDLAMNAG